MKKCLSCDKELTKAMLEEGYDTIYNCTCGVKNYVPIYNQEFGLNG